MASQPMEVAPSSLAPSAEQQNLVNLHQLLETQLGENSLENAFHGCIKRVLIPEGRVASNLRELNLLDTLRSLFSSSPQESWPVYVEDFVMYVSEQTNPYRISLLLDTLHSLVASGNLKPRVVCEVLLKHLTIENEAVWSKSLELVRKIIGGVDYKGCRELMKLLLDRFDKLPRCISNQDVPAIKNGQMLLSYILDRNAALLPAYFAHDEFGRHYPFDKSSSPHWVLHEVIGKLKEEMKKTADLVSGIVLPHLRPVLGVSNVSVNSWRLDPKKHCCALKGLLPYREEFVAPQTELLFHIIAQPNSRDAVHSILGMTRQQLKPSELVEDALVQLAMVAMEISEGCGREEDQVFEVWSHFASQLVFFYFYQLINITSVLNKLRRKLSCSKLSKGRSWMMWALLHHVTSTVQSKSAQASVLIEKEFIPMINLFTVLYQDKEPLPVPTPSSVGCVVEAAAASIWVIFAGKAESDGTELPRPLPYVVSRQIEWIKNQTEAPPTSDQLSSDFTVPLLLNIHSNNAEISGKLLDIMLEGMVPSSAVGGGAATPLSLPALNSLAMHAKIRLMEMVKTHLIRVAENSKQGQPTASSNMSDGADSGQTITQPLLETYSRLLVWLGTRNFQTQLIPAVFKSQAWSVLHALLEIIAFRVHLQLQYSYRFQLLQQLHTVASVSIIPAQLFGSAENAALRLIRGLSSPEFLLQLAKQFATDPKPLLSTDSEELNRVFVVVVAQSLHISNIDTTNWLESFMKTVLTTAPNSWCASTIQFFPLPLRQLCTPARQEDYKSMLVARVEDETKRFKGSSEMDQLRIFTETDSAQLSLCVLWKLLMETSSVNLTCIKIAQLTQPKKLAAHMRKLVDYVIFTLPPPSSNPSQLNNVIAQLDELIWKYNLFPLDRLVLCMVLRGYEPQYNQLCLTLLHCLLLRTSELSRRVSLLVDEVPADYWNQPDWNMKHQAYLKESPESFQPDARTTSSPSKHTTIPMYFGNVCLRFLPVLDLLIQRILELPEVASQSLEKLLEKYGPLYKFHDQPMSFLYTTLQYYEPSLSSHPLWKKTLVSAVIDSQKAVRPMDWYFTSEFCEYLSNGSHGSTWDPTRQYYSHLVERLIKGLQPFSSNAPACDWHFSEFSCALTLLLHCSCVELLTHPSPAPTIIKQLLQTLYDKAKSCREKDVGKVLAMVNALGLVMVSLPESFRCVLYDEVLSVVAEPPMPRPPLSSLHSLAGGERLSCMLAVMHSYWQHANIGLLLQLPTWMQNSLRPVVKEEWQLLYVCHLMGPTLNRLASGKPKLLLEVVMEIYRLVQTVDKHQEGKMAFSDLLCDFLYHIKYMHIGDQEETEAIVSTLHDPLKLRLRFLLPASADKPQAMFPSNNPPLLPTGSSMPVST